MENETGLDLPRILIQEPAVNEHMLGDNEFGRLASHGTGIITQKKDHCLGFEIFLSREDAIDLIIR